LSVRRVQSMCTARVRNFTGATAAVAAVDDDDDDDDDDGPTDGDDDCDFCTQA